jgi:hypothetical protein
LADCSSFPDFTDIYDWCANYPNTACGESAWVPMGSVWGGVFSSNSACPDSNETYYFNDLAGAFWPFVTESCAPCQVAFGRVQIGFQPSTTYYIVETYSGAVDNIIHVHRACAGSVAGASGYTPVEMGVPWVNGMSGCAIPNMRNSDTDSAGNSNRLIFAPSAGYTSPANGGYQLVYAASSLADAASQAISIIGGPGASYAYDTGWNCGSCNPPDEDPFDSGLP